MGTILFLAIVIWGAAMLGWFFVSRYFRSSDALRIKERLTGSGKTTVAKKKGKGATGEQSVFHTQQASKNRLAVLLVEKYRLGPKIQTYLEQAGLSQWTPARLVHLCIVAFLSGLGAAAELIFRELGE